jgi:uncharacterized protein YbcV (DUF1398 family)
MQASTRAVIQSTFQASNNGSIHFGQVVSRLIEVEVETYHVDYRSGRTTYYLPNGDTVDLKFEMPKHGINATFDSGALRAAILGAQQGKLMYPEFKLISQNAGCVGYTVWIAGRHAVYFGRRGETHVENFPN